MPYVPRHSAYPVSKLAGVKIFEYVQDEHPNLRVFNLQPGIIESTGIASKATEQSGFSWPQQDTRKYFFGGTYKSVETDIGLSHLVLLPANFMVWLSSSEAAFLKGKLIWAN